MCTIFGILAIGTHYAHLGANYGQAADSTTHYPSNIASFPGESAGLASYHQACRLLPDVITIASLESVQVCVILGVFALPLDASGLAWTYLGLAIKLAVLNPLKITLIYKPGNTETGFGKPSVLLKGKKDMSSHLSPGRPVSVIPIEIDTDLSSVQHKRSSSAIPSLSNSL